MSGPLRTNIFARLLAEVDDGEEGNLLDRELGINKNTGILYYKDSDGRVRSLDVTSIASDIRNNVIRRLRLDPGRPNMIGSGYDNSNVFVDRIEAVKPTIIHSIECEATGASTNYVLVLRDNNNLITDYVEIPNMYQNGSTEDSLDLGTGVINNESIHEYANIYSRVEHSLVDMFLISNIKHHDDVVTYPEYEIISDLSEADMVESVGKVYHDYTNKDVYIIAQKGAIVSSILHPDVIVSRLEHSVVKTFTPFIPYVDMEYSIELVKTYKIDSYSDENGEILYPTNIDVSGLLVARSDVSGTTITNINVDSTNFKLTNMQPNTSYYILLALNNPVDETPKVTYSYVEFFDLTLPNVMRSLDSLSSEFQNIRPTVIQIVEEYTKNYWDGYSPGFMEASFTVKTSATTFKIKTPLHDYDEASDILLLFKDGSLIIKNQDYRILEENGEIFLEKLINGVVDTTEGWNANTLLKAVVLIKTGVTDKNIIYRTYESAFNVLHPDTTTIPIGIAEYNMNDEDILMVSQDNSMIFKNVNYLIKSGTIIHGETEYIGPYIELVDCNASAGTWFFFFVIKASRSTEPVGTIDPKRIRKGLTLDQFEGDLARTLITPNTILNKSLAVRPNNSNAAMVAMVDAAMIPTIKNGHLIIQLPFGWIDTNLSVTIDIKPLNNSDKSMKVELTGFLSMDNYAWENTSVLMIGSPNTQKVTLAYYNGRACIIFGNSDTHWDKPIIKVSNLFAIGDKLDGWNTGWSFGIYDYDETIALGLTRILLPQVQLISPNI